MAIVKFIPARKPQSSGGLYGSMEYCKREQKTWDEASQQHLVTGVNCVADTAYREFMNTKRFYEKTEGRMYYHVVQSFSPEEQLTAETAHEIALKLAREFAGFEVLVCTHTDRDHLHSHLIINSVSAEDGRKYHSDKDNIRRIRMASDELCMQYGLSVVKPKQKRTPGMSAAEYRSADRGESWKLRLAIAIDDAMAAARSRAHFIELMEMEGYRVRWEKDRKHITYTTPEGKQCRDIRLHEAKYVKENMELEFRIRKQILYGPEETGEREYEHRSQSGTRISGNREELERPAEIPGWDPGNAGSLLRRDADPGVTGGTGENPGPAADHDAGASGRYEGADGGIPDVHRDDGDEFADTGWECERQLFRRYLEGGSVHEILAHEAALDLGHPFGGADPAGAGALDLVGSLSRLKGDPEDPEERKREIEARNAADNLGIAIGLAIAAAEALLEKQNETEEHNHEHQLMQ
jgi:hypothetical protein